MTWELYCEEVRPYWLLVTKEFGFMVDDIDWACPADLEPYAKAYRMQLEQQDSQLHIMGMYVLSAVSVAIERNFSKRAKGKYIEKPLLYEMDHKNGTMTENEMQKQRELFVARLEAMGANFRISRKRKENEDQDG